MVGDFLATTDDSGELMDTFHLFGDDTTTAGGGKGDGVGGEGGGEEGEEGSATAAAGAGGGQSVAKLKTLDGEAFCSCLEMCFEHMVRPRTDRAHRRKLSWFEGRWGGGGRQPGEKVLAGM